jgi:hypothetical protein
MAADVIVAAMKIEDGGTKDWMVMARILLADPACDDGRVSLTRNDQKKISALRMGGVCLVPRKSWQGGRGGSLIDIEMEMAREGNG